MSEMLSLGDTLVKRAKEQGAEEAEIYMVSEKKNTVNIEKNEIQIGKSQDKNEVGIRILVGDKIGFASVNSFDKDKILPKIDEAVSLAKTSIEDKYNVIPGPKKIEKRKNIYDPEIKNFDIKDSLEYAERMLKSAKEYDERFQFNTGIFTATDKHKAIVNSKGIESKEKSSNFSYVAMGMAVDGQDVSSFDMKNEGVHHVKNIDVESLGKEVAESTVNSLGAEKGEKFVGPVLFSPYGFMNICMSLVQSLKANKIQKGMSKLEGRLGENIAHPSFTVKDDSTIERGLGCRAFDREGLPTPNVDLIKDGKLMNFYHNSYTAEKDGIKSTGHAAGDAGTIPKINPSNFVVETGRKTKESLIEEIDKGIIVNRYSGNIDPVSGDFSGVAKGGHMIKEGEKKYPIKETMVSGNVFELLNNISGISKCTESIPGMMMSGDMHFFVPFIRFDEVSITSD